MTAKSILNLADFLFHLDRRDVMDGKRRNKATKKGGTGPQQGRVSEARLKELQAVFQSFGLNPSTPYQGAEDLARRFQRVGLLRSDGVTFSTSASSLSYDG